MRWQCPSCGDETQATAEMVLAFATPRLVSLCAYCCNAYAEAIGQGYALPPVIAHKSNGIRWAAAAQIANERRRNERGSTVVVGARRFPIGSAVWVVEGNGQPEALTITAVSEGTITFTSSDVVRAARQFGKTDTYQTFLGERQATMLRAEGARPSENRAARRAQMRRKAGTNAS